MKHMMIKVLSLLMALTMIMGMFGTMGISAAEHTHTKGDTVRVVKPTCTSAGYTVYKCADCKEMYQDDIVAADADAHNLKAYYLNGNVRGKGAATCDEPAATEGLRCVRCQKVVKESEYIKDSEPLGHDYTIELQLPTCENPGMVYRSCARCVAEELANAEEDVLGLLDEEDKDGFVYLGTVSPIPAENGKHVFVYEVVKAPTCKGYGVARYFCKLCDEINFENIAVRNDPDAHVYEDVKGVAATCTTDGYTDHTKCTVCGKEVGKTKLNKTNHANSSFLNANSDYAVKNGIDAAEINTTGKASVAEALNYMTTLASCTKDAQFWAQCNDCGTVWNKTFTAAHKYEATSKTVADKVYAFADIVADGKWYKTANATCESGVTFVAKCAKGCGHYQETTNTSKLGTTGKHIWGTKNTPAFAPVTTAATCTTGEFVVYKCMFPGCGSTQTVYTASSLGHDYYYDCEVVGCPGNDGNNATDCPTCEHARTKKCTRCTDVSIAVPAATAHNYKTVDVVASCRTIAHQEDVCQNEGCTSVIVKDDTYTGTVDSANHAGENLTKTVPATCYAEGTKYLACDCGVKTWTVAIPKLACNGTYTVLAAVPANCNTIGKTEGLSCSVHGVVVAQIDTPFDKTNHNVATATLKTQVVGTCYIEGYRTYTCGNAACKAETGIAPEFTIVDGKNANNHANKDGVPAFKTGKDLKAATHTTAGTHGYKICAYCNVNIELDKALNTDTCQICKIANDNQLPSPHRTYAEGEAYTGGILSVVEIPATGHVLTVSPAVAAGHDTAGATAALVCANCPDNNNETLVVYGGDIIAPHGDRYLVTLKDATCTTSGLACDGYVAGDKVCAYCKDIKYVSAAHNIVTVETGRTTVNGDTVTVKACSVCDVKFEEVSETWYLDDYVAAHEHNFKNDADKTKEYYETKEMNSNEFYGRTDKACQVATYKVAKCQTCSEWVIIETVKAAPGHYVGAKKTPMALGCKDYVLGTNCAACGLAITAKDDPDIVHNWGSGDNYGVVKVPTCTESGIAVRVCIDCGVKKPLDPGTVAKYAAYDWSWDPESRAFITPALGHSPVSLESYEFSKESDNVVTYTATCTVCEEKYTEEVNILKDYVVFTASAKDPNGSEWTANGSTVIVTIAYTAADYKFRDLTAIYDFDDDALTFQKAEVVADLAGASTDVVVNDGKVTIYTFVSVPGETTVISGDEVAYVELYFTVNETAPNGVVKSFFDYQASILAHVYDEDDKLVVDNSKWFISMPGDDISAYVTGDIDNDGAFTPADLLAVMDLIYGEDAEYDAIADIDKDGDVDVDDFAALKTFVLSKKTAKDYIIMVKGEYVDIMSALLAIAKEEGLDADGNGVVTRADVSDILTASSELYWYVHAAEVNWTYGAALNATMVQEADFTDVLVDAYNAYMAAK